MEVKYGYPLGINALHHSEIRQNVTTESVQKIANEPPLVGFEDDGDERKRRWDQCVNFLRNNPKLLL